MEHRGDRGTPGRRAAADAKVEFETFGQWGRLLRGLRAAVTAVVLCGALGTGVYVWWTWDLDGHEEKPVSTAERSVGVGSGTVEETTDTTVDDAAAVVAAWDHARARTWASGDPRALSALYSDRSSAGRDDVAALKEWTSAGWRVEGVAPRLVRVEEVRRSASRLVVDVTDQFEGAVAVGEASGERVSLPAGTERTRRLTLVKGDDETGRSGSQWRVQRVLESDQRARR